jgi:hypothetical protein
MCLYFESIKKITIKDKFPIPLIDDLFDELSGSKYFTKVYLDSGYHHISMKEEDIPKTGFRTHDGHYEFFVMTFVLCIAPYTFQILMNYVFQSLMNHVFHHFLAFSFDEILIYSKNWPTHLPIGIKFSMYSLSTIFSSNNLNLPLEPQKWIT